MEYSVFKVDVEDIECNNTSKVNDGGEISMNELLQRISIDPKICFGKPCIRGTRIWVSLILDFLASGTSTQEILEDYPHLTEEDVRACIAYGAEMSRERYVEVATEVRG